MTDNNLLINRIITALLDPQPHTSPHWMLDDRPAAQPAAWPAGRSQGPPSRAAGLGLEPPDWIQAPPARHSGTLHCTRVVCFAKLGTIRHCRHLDFYRIRTFFQNGTSDRAVGYNRVAPRCPHTAVGYNRVCQPASPSPPGCHLPGLA